MSSLPILTPGISQAETMETVLLHHESICCSQAASFRLAVDVSLNSATINIYAASKMRHSKEGNDCLLKRDKLKKMKIKSLETCFKNKNCTDQSPKGSKWYK